MLQYYQVRLFQSFLPDTNASTHLVHARSRPAAAPAAQRRRANNGSVVAAAEQSPTAATDVAAPNVVTYHIML